MSQRYMLAIDEGTTGTTALLFDHDGRIRGRGYREFRQYYPQPGWVEHDAMEIWTATTAVMREALAAAGANAAEVHGIGITNQRETIVLWERATGRPVAPAIVWQDRRTAPLCEQLKSEGCEPDWQARTGLLIDPYFSGTKLAWMLENVDGVRRRAAAGELAFGTIDSWLLWQLTAGACHGTDVSNASRTLLYNIHDLDWDPVLLQRLGIPERLLPCVRPSACIHGETAPSAFFGRRVPVAGLAGDQQAALFGQACLGEGLAKNTYGTGCFLLMHTGTKPVMSRQRMLTTIAWQVGDAAVEYSLEGSVFVAGAAVQWLRDGLHLIRRADETEALAAGLASNEDVFFVPALTGLGAPHWDPYARGTLLGLTRGTTAAHIARATLEAICYQTRDVVEAMQRDSGVVLRELRADGGAVGNAFLMQFQADILGVPVAVPEVTETTGFGAACLAGLATGFWPGRREIDATWRLARRYEPRMPAAERDRLYGRWLKAVERARGWV